MLVVMAEGATKEQAERVAAVAREQRFHAELVGDEHRIAVAITGGAEKPDSRSFDSLPGVGRCVGHPEPE